MHTNQLQTLVVESGVASRRELVNVLHETQFVSVIVEAESFKDALITLKRGDMDACVLGPTLSFDRTLSFLEESANLGLTKPCGMIAVSASSWDNSQLAALKKAGADETVSQPLVPGTFTATVKNAIAKSHSRFFLSQTSLTHILLTLSKRLEQISEDCRKGKLRLNSQGLPSLATQDAIRLALESALPNPEQAQLMGSAEHNYITALVEWFNDRISCESSEAKGKLRRRLEQAGA